MLTKNIFIIKNKNMQNQTSFVTSPPKKTRGNRNRSPFFEKQKTMEINSSFDDKLISHDDSRSGILLKSDTSFINQQDDDQTQNKQLNKNDTISQKQKQQDDEQLKPDMSSTDNKILNESNWDQDDKKQVEQLIKKRGNRNKQTQKQKQAKNTSPQSQNDTNSGSNKNINPDHQLPTQSTAPKRRGNRYNQSEDSAQGSTNQRKPYQNYNRNQGSNNYRGNRDYNSGYRGNRQYNPTGRDNNSYRGGRGRGGYYNNYDRRNYGSDRDDQNPQNNQKKFETDKQLNQSTYKNPDFQKKRKPYEQRNFNDNYRSNPPYRGYEPEIVQKIIEKPVVIQKQKIVEKLIQPTRPIGIRAHPSVSIYVKGCKLELTCRRLEKFKADLLVIPYKTAKLQLYPGSFVNSLKVNYKEKLKEKGPKLQEQNKLVYMQKCFGSDNISALAFMKVADPQNNVKNGIKELLENIKRIQNSKKQKGDQTQTFQSIIFPICSQLQAFKAIISSFIKEIEKYSNIVKDVYISTEDPKAFCEAVTKFNQIFVQLFEDNQISFN